MLPELNSKKKISVISSASLNRVVLKKSSIDGLPYDS